MPRRHWHTIRPTSISHAMELCIQHAQETKNFNVDRIADAMGLPNKWQIYRWMENGRMPTILIRSFEDASGIDFVTQYIAHSDHKLLIKIPTGRKTDSSDIHQLQQSFTDAIDYLLKFSQDKTNAEDTLAALTETMQELAWHRGNVEKAMQPEFDFGGITSE